MLKPFSPYFQFSLGRPVVDSLAGLRCGIRDQLCRVRRVLTLDTGVRTGSLGRHKDPDTGDTNTLCHDLVTTTWGLVLSAHYEWLSVFMRSCSLTDETRTPINPLYIFREALRKTTTNS